MALNHAPLMIFKPLKFHGLLVHGLACGWMLKMGTLTASFHWSAAP